jgi:hypothetical protein
MPPLLIITQYQVAFMILVAAIKTASVTLEMFIAYLKVRRVKLLFINYVQVMFAKVL